jgi:hypothetical protein
VYVIIHHFTDDKFGKHVALVVIVLQIHRGERHEYLLCHTRTSYANEHVGVYILNPDVCANPDHPVVAFDVHRGLAWTTVVVETDTCPLVHTIPVVDMHDGLTVFVTDTRTGFRFSLCFYFYSE